MHAVCHCGDSRWEWPDDEDYMPPKPKYETDSDEFEDKAEKESIHDAETEEDSDDEPIITMRVNKTLSAFTKSGAKRKPPVNIETYRFDDFINARNAKPRPTKLIGPELHETDDEGEDYMKSYEKILGYVCDKVENFVSWKNNVTNIADSCLCVSIDPGYRNLGISVMLYNKDCDWSKTLAQSLSHVYAINMRRYLLKSVIDIYAAEGQIREVLEAYDELFDAANIIVVEGQLKKAPRNVAVEHFIRDYVGCDAARFGKLRTSNISERCTRNLLEEIPGDFDYRKGNKVMRKKNTFERIAQILTNSKHTKEVIVQGKASHYDGTDSFIIGLIELQKIAYEKPVHKRRRGLGKTTSP